MPKQLKPGELDDIVGEIKLAQSDVKRTSDSANTGQRSLFTYGIEGMHKSDDEKINREGMKKAAVDKLNKEDAIRELKAKQKADEAEAAKKAGSYQRSMVSPGGNIFKGATSGGGGGGGGGSMTDPMDRKTKPYNKAKGGVIKSASKRADGCAIRGKTRA
jgi:hypothetical protein